jgi:hypothetical protein
VRNSPSATLSEIARRTAFSPNRLATLRMSSKVAAEEAPVAERATDWAGVLKGISECAAYWAAFTSFQISLYLARRGTFCQK